MCLFYCHCLLVSIQAIEMEHGRRVEHCFTAFLKKWLQDDPKLEYLMESLRGQIVNRADVANDLETKIKTGELKW